MLLHKLILFYEGLSFGDLDKFSFKYFMFLLHCTSQPFWIIEWYLLGYKLYNLNLN